MLLSCEQEFILELKPVYFKFAEIQVQKFNYLKKK